MTKKTIIFFISAIVIGIFLSYSIPQTGFTTNKPVATEAPAGCNAYILIYNKSAFDVDLVIDGFPSGHLLSSQGKNYKVELSGDEAKRIKVKVSYLDPDYIEAKSFLMSSKKIECEQTDTMYVAIYKQ